MSKCRIGDLLLVQRRVQLVSGLSVHRQIALSVHAAARYGALSGRRQRILPWTRICMVLRLPIDKDNWMVLDVSESGVVIENLKRWLRRHNRGVNVSLQQLEFTSAAHRQRFESKILDALQFIFRSSDLSPPIVSEEVPWSLLVGPEMKQSSNSKGEKPNGTPHWVLDFILRLRQELSQPVLSQSESCRMLFFMFDINNTWCLGRGG